MRPTPAKITSFTVYPPRRPDQSPKVHMKVELYPGLEPGGASVDVVEVDTLMALDIDNDTFSDINKRAAVTIHAALQRAAQLSLEEIERSVQHSLEYDEHRA